MTFSPCWFKFLFLIYSQEQQKQCLMLLVRSLSLSLSLPGSPRPKYDQMVSLICSVHALHFRAD